MIHKVRNLLVIYPVEDKQQMFLDNYMDHTPKLNSVCGRVITEPICFL